MMKQKVKKKVKLHHRYHLTSRFDQDSILRESKQGRLSKIWDV